MQEPSGERWLPVPGFDGYYEVSDAGRVRSLPRVVIRRNGYRFPVSGRVMRTVRGSRGHRLVKLHGPDDEERNVQVHRLVLSAFVGPCPPNMEGCHGNGDPADNRLSNLRWDTRSGNQRDSVRHGTHRCGQMFKTHCPFGHPLEMPNLTAWGVKRDSRICLACARARAEGRRRQARGQVVDMAALRAHYYAAIIGESAT